MAAAQLRFLAVLCGQFVTDAVEQLHVALLRVLLHDGDERPRHGASGLARDVCILSIEEVSRRSRMNLAGRP